MALKEPEEERRVKSREIDGTAFSIVSYLHGLNALGNWPRSVPVHIIKPHEEKEGAQEPQPGRGRGKAVSHSCHTPGSKGSLFQGGFYNMCISFFFPRVFQMINISSGQRGEENQSNPERPGGCLRVSRACEPEIKCGL